MHTTESNSQEADLLRPRLLQPSVRRFNTYYEARSNLIAHPEHVRAGEELLVKDRNLHVGWLVSLAAGEDFDARELEMAYAARSQASPRCGKGWRRSGL